MSFDWQSSSQNHTSSQNVANKEESDDEENDIDNDEVDAVGGEQGDGDDSGSETDDDSVTLQDWLPEQIDDFVPILLRSSPRSPSTTETAVPTTEDLLPEFTGYKGRGNFDGVNKRAIEDARCTSALDFLLLFITTAILSTFVKPTNYWGNTFHKKYWTHNLDISELKAFIAVVLELGVNNMSSRCENWRFMGTKYSDTSAFNCSTLQCWNR